MSYQVIARKWRPQTFADVIGQQHVGHTLANAVLSGRVAHSYIFSGARGVGKTTMARILAKALNCAKGPAAEPCNECVSCMEISAGNSMDVIEIDAASNRGIDQIRELRDMVRYAPTGGHYKVIILDEAHMLTDEASNALLKTIEEPPDKVIFVMATTEPEKLADTIRSRSQHFHFRALDFAEIVNALEGICVKEGLTAESGALGVMARAAEGSLRDALSLLEQARSYCGTTITDAQVRELLGVVPEEILDELIAAIEERSAKRVLALVHRLLAVGQNLQHFCREAIGHIRNLLVARVCGADSDLIAAPADQRPRLAKAAALFSEEDLTRFFQILLHTDDDLRRKPDQRLHLEMGLLRMVNAARLAPLEEVLAGLDGGSSGSATGNSSGAPPSVPPRAREFSAAPDAPKAPADFSQNAFAAAASQSAPSSSPWQKAPPAASVANSNPVPAPRSFSSLAFTKVATQLEPVPTAIPPRESVATSAPAESSSNGTKQLAEQPLTATATAIAVPEVKVEEEESKTEQAASAASRSSEVKIGSAGEGLTSEQVDSIKSAVLAQQKFLGELIEHVGRWESSGGELRLVFPTESRSISEMLGRDAMERLRNIASGILGHPVRVCVKLESMTTANAAGQSSNGTRELRAKFEQDPIVRAMIERFGGQISEVKRRSED